MLVFDSKVFLRGPELYLELFEFKLIVVSVDGTKEATDPDAYEVNKMVEGPDPLME